jgi:hypothetical protein
VCCFLRYRVLSFLSRCVCYILRYRVLSFLRRCVLYSETQSVFISETVCVIFWDRECFHFWDGVCYILRSRVLSFLSLCSRTSKNIKIKNNYLGNISYYGDLERSICLGLHWSVDYPYDKINLNVFKYLSAAKQQANHWAPRACETFDPAPY